MLSVPVGMSNNLTDKYGPKKMFANITPVTFANIAVRQKSQDTSRRRWQTLHNRW